MKKKLLFIALAMALLMCVLAVGTYAAGFESGYDVSVEAYDTAPDWVNVEDRDATAVIRLASGSFARVPTAYVFKANSNNQFATNGSNLDFGWISEKLGETVTIDNLVALELPHGTKSVSGAISSSTFKSLTELVIPSTVTSLPQKFIRDNVVIEKLFIKQTTDAEGNVVGVTAIPDYFADMQGSNVSALEYFKLELDYVTSVGANAFNKSAIKEITLKGPMTKVGGFSSCPNLTTVNINNTGDVITIGGKAFAYSKQLTSVTLNGFNLSNYLFEEVNGLTGGLRVVVTNAVTLGDMPFKNASNLEYVEISGPLTSFGASTFLGCHNLTTAVINNTGSKVATSSASFSELKAIKNVTINGVELGYRMFYKVTTLEKLVYSNIGTVIGREAFRGTTITEFTVPAGFTLISQHAFADCKSLATVTFAGEAGENAEIGYASFENAKALKTVIIPEGVTTLGECPFKNAGVTYLSLPTTLKYADGYGNQFYGCPLETVVGLENTQLTTIPHSMFRGQGKWKPEVLKIPDTVESIGTYGFADCGASVVIIGTGVKSIGSEAFVNCKATTYYIPHAVEEILGSAFNKGAENILYFVTSGDADYVTFIKSNSLSTKDAVSYETYLANKDNYATGRYVIYGCNLCDVYHGGVHAMAGEESVNVTSYFAPITVGDRCTRDGCGNFVITTTIDAIFVDRGYSCTETAIGGKYSVSQFYEINKASCEAYKLATGTEFDYGFVVSVSNDPMNPENSDLIANGKTYVMDSKLLAYDYFSIGVIGITDGENGTANTLDKKLTFCLYVKDGEKTFYLDGGKTVSAVEQKSYTDVLALVK